MYGLVNQALQGLITEEYGIEKWNSVKKNAGIEIDYFVSNEPYEDSITFDLIATASDVLNIPSSQILQSFGGYWILRTSREKYGDLMKAGGSTFLEFMMNLPNFHSRIMLIYPKLSPPEFMMDKKSESELIMHYYSSRDGLSDFVVGLIEGLAEMFETQIIIKLLSTEKTENWHDTFSINILNH